MEVTCPLTSKGTVLTLVTKSSDGSLSLCCLILTAANDFADYSLSPSFGPSYQVSALSRCCFTIQANSSQSAWRLPFS